MDLKVLKFAADTKNHKLLKNYDHILKQKNSFCGDEITISIKMKNNKILRIGYDCKSCIYTQATASMLSIYFKNKSIGKIEDIIFELDKFCMKKTKKLPKSLSFFSKIINSQNLCKKRLSLASF